MRNLSNVRVEALELVPGGVQFLRRILRHGACAHIGQQHLQKAEPLAYVVVQLAGNMLAFFLLRVLKAILIALQYKHKAEEGRLAPD